ncbi:hypothetical protein DBR43_20340 [Pedobacter sp. KBW06]|uniref:hypothetical protein n=1 Tax=Pedobacter sp. KBW06 TaxID=2153359 RepID=UPI000F5A1C59|nr:hypothetical protein [Pedobacter sp. KBW06]RQO70371.1 hypothetical protein DBR43_20340 [Pedobacter sp. KBW06]
MANSWYSYLGAGKDPLVPASYRRMTVKPECVCGPAICSIYLLGETATTPSAAFTPNILTYISNALTNGSPQPIAAGGGLKLFVYMKSGCCG